MEDKKRAYMKEYYEKNKERLREQIKKSQDVKRRNMMIDKLNNNEYKRIPYNRIAEKDIKYKSETKRYT